MAGDQKSIVAAVAEVNDLKEAISDLKKEINEALESLTNFGRVGSLSVRNLGTEARSLQSTFRDLSRDLRRTTTPSGTIGAAATSQALGTLTGGGRGGGGGGGGGEGHAGQFGSSFRLGSRIGDLVGKGISGAGGLFKDVPFFGGALKKGAEKLGGAASLVTSAALSGGVKFLENATRRHTELERAGMGFGGWQGNLPDTISMKDRKKWLERAESPTAGLNKPMATGARFGFNVQEQLQTAFPLLPLAGRGDRGRQRLQNFVSKTLLPASTAAGVGVDTGVLSEFTGSIREAGQGFNTAARIIRGARSAFGAGNARETIGLLSAIKTSIGVLINTTGRATRGQIVDAAQTFQGIRRHTGYQPGVAAGLATQLHQAGISPGGGEAGQVAMLQTMGFGMPNLGRQQDLAQQMGMRGKDASRFGKRRGYLQALLAMKRQSGSQATQSLLLTARRIAGEDPLHQAQVMSQLVPGLQLPVALDLVQKKGDKTLSRRVGEAFTKGKDFTAEGREDAATTKFQASIPLIKEHMKLVHLSLATDKQKLAEITKAMTQLKVVVLEPTTKLLLALPAAVEKSTSVITTAVDSLVSTIDEFIKKLKNPRTGS